MWRNSKRCAHIDSGLMLESRLRMDGSHQMTEMWTELSVGHNVSEKKKTSLSGPHGQCTLPTQHVWTPVPALLLGSYCSHHSGPQQTSTYILVYSTPSKILGGFLSLPDVYKERMNPGHWIHLVCTDQGQRHIILMNFSKTKLEMNVWNVSELMGGKRTKGPVDYSVGRNNLSITHLLLALSSGRRHWTPEASMFSWHMLHGVVFLMLPKHKLKTVFVGIKSIVLLLFFFFNRSTTKFLSIFPNWKKSSYISFWLIWLPNFCWKQCITETAFRVLCKTHPVTSQHPLVKWCGFTHNHFPPLSTEKLLQLEFFTNIKPLVL